MPVGSLRPLLSAAFGLVILFAPSARASPACDVLAERDQAVCERAERENPQWRELRDAICTPTKEAESYEWISRFVQTCRQSFVDKFDGHRFATDWQARRDTYFRQVVIATTPLTTFGGQKLPAQLIADLKQWADGRLHDAIDETSSNEQPDPGDVSIDNHQFGSVVQWLTPGLASIGYFEWRYEDGMPHGNYNHSFELRDMKSGRTIADLSEIFTNPSKVIDVVADIVATQIADQSDEVGLIPKEKLLPEIARLELWRFSAEGVQVIFNSYDLGSYITPSTDLIPYKSIARYIKKDGPLGRALGLK